MASLRTMASAQPCYFCVFTLGWLLRVDAFQQKSYKPELTSLDEDTSGEKVWWDPEDYSSAIRQFLKKNPNGISDSVQRYNLSIVNEEWKRLEGTGKHGDEARHGLIQNFFQNEPAIIPNTADELNWPARERWEAKALKARLGNMEVAEYTYGFKPVGSNKTDSLYKITPPTMKTLAQYMDRTSNGGNHLLFINEAWDSYVHPSEMKIAKLLKDDWSPRPVFSYPHGDQHSLMFPETIANGHGWHYHDEVWHTQVVGRKLWHLHPKTHSSNPNEGLIDEKGKHEYVPNTCAYVSGKQKPPKGTLTIFTHPGDTLILPAYWWHATCALDTWTMGAGTFLKHQEVSAEDKKNRRKQGW